MVTLGVEVRVLEEPKGSINEFAVVKAVYPDGAIWIANLNMPYSGNISCIVLAEDIAKTVEVR